MDKLLHVLGIFCLIFVFCNAQDSSESKVLVLTDDNIDQTLKDNARVLLEFYAPWCGHCKQLAPEYEKAASALHASGSKTKLAKVDATVHTVSASQYGVKGYPTLFYVLNGKASEYQGPREADGIVDYLRKKEQPVISIFKNDAKPVDHFLKKDPKTEIVVVAYVEKKSGKFNAIKKAAENLNNQEKTNHWSFAAVYIESGEEPKLELHRLKWEDQLDSIALYSGVWNVELLSKWLRLNAMQNGAKYDKDSQELAELQHLGYNGVLISVYEPKMEIEEVEKDGDADDDDLDKESSPSHDVALAKLKEEMKQFSKTNKKYVTAYLPNNELNEEKRKILGMAPGSTRPQKAIVHLDKENQRPVRYVTTELSMEEFADQHSENKLQPHRMSAPLPPNPTDENGVTIVTGSTFDSIVMNKRKNVLLEIYAPWCQHCKKLEPVYANLAKSVAQLGWNSKQYNVVIAKMDGTENESPETITGFPHIVLFPASKRKMKDKVKYTGAQEKVLSFLEFLRDNAIGLEDVDDSVLTLLGEHKKESMVERELKKKREEKAAKEEL